MKQTTNIKYFGKNKRRNYGIRYQDFENQDLLKFQIDLFKKFIRYEIPELIGSYFPIQSNDDRIKVEFVRHELKYPSNWKKEEVLAKEKRTNFAAKFHIVLRLENQATGDIQEESLFVCDFPLMTSASSFIINGSEKVVVSQLSKSSGLLSQESKVGSSTGDRFVIYNSLLLSPKRGFWFEFIYRSYNLMQIKRAPIRCVIDKTNKMDPILFFRAFGIKLETLNKYFSWNELYNRTVDSFTDLSDSYTARLAIFKILNKHTRIIEENVNSVLSNLFYNKNRYDFGKVARFKINDKLSLANKLIGQKLAEDIVDNKGKVLIKAKTNFSYKESTILQNAYLDKKINFESIADVDKSILFSIGNKTYKPQVGKIHRVKIFATTDKETKVVDAMGIDPTQKIKYVTVADILASFSNLLMLDEGLLKYDNIDSLENRRIKTVSELLLGELNKGLNIFVKSFLDRINQKNVVDFNIKKIATLKPIRNQINLFFNVSPLCQFLNQTNILSELTNKKRITALGPGGLTGDTVLLEVRSIQDSHRGRICPIETPEGPNIGLILNLTLYSRISEYGFLLAPYYVVKNKKITNELVYLPTEEALKKKIAFADSLDLNGNFISDTILAYSHGENIKVPVEEIDLIEISPNQIFSPSTACIPFVEHNDASRALMGANMQKQAVPLLFPESPLVSTGVEPLIAKSVSSVIKSSDSGVVDFVDSKKIVILDDAKKKHTYKLDKFKKSNQDTTINSSPLVKIGEKVKPNQIIADSSSTKNGELSIGSNLLVAFSTWYGYNYEDAVIISERIVQNDKLTSVYIKEFVCKIKETTIGKEKMTADIPDVAQYLLRNLDKNGIITIGSHVKSGDVLVGKVTPKTEEDQSGEDRLVNLIFGKSAAANWKNTSLNVPNSFEGIVVDVKVLSLEKGDKLDRSDLAQVYVYVAQKRKINTGDKVAGRHGNKGIISKVLPIEDMPYLEDGTPVDIILSPLGVPSRMNIGQLLELYVGFLAKKLNTMVAVPSFSNQTKKMLTELQNETNIHSDKFDLYDGRTGEKFREKIAAGYMYILKLEHMVVDKIHSRSVGPSSLITQQPLGGKSQKGGQRFGEMESWALEGYGAAHNLRELFTLKSDDVFGRTKMYNALIRNSRLPEPSLPEAFHVLNFELMALGMKIEIQEKNRKIIQEDNKEIFE